MKGVMKHETVQKETITEATGVLRSFLAINDEHKHANTQTWQRRRF
ncbi:hypothetical protein STFR1_130032 [Bacillus vallismortis]